MRKLPIMLAILAVLSPQGSLAAAVPSKLSGVIVMSCVTTDAGVKVDEDIYKIDFVKKQVNNEPVEFVISDISLAWNRLKKHEVEPWDRPNRREVIQMGRYISINRYSGKLESGFSGGVSKRLTVCRVAASRKF